MGWPKEGMKPEEAAIALAKVLSDGLGVEVSALKLYDLIRTKWSRVQCLAHTIHEMPDAATAFANVVIAQNGRMKCPGCNGSGRI